MLKISESNGKKVPFLIWIKYIPVTVVTLFWGVSFVATKFVVDVFPPFPAAFYRFVIALVLLFPFVNKKEVFRDLFDINAFWTGFWGITMYFVFENTALIYTSATNAAVIVSSAPILYVLFTHLFHKRRTNSLHYSGSIVAFSGVALAIINGRILKLNPIGDILAFGSALSWVLYTHYVLKIKKSGGIDQVFLITFWGVITLIPFYLLQKVKPVFEIKSFVGLLYLGIICSAVGYFLWNKSIVLIGDRRTTNTIYFIPLVTIFSESLLIMTPLTLYGVFGVVFLIIGLYIFERGEKYGEK